MARDSIVTSSDNDRRRSINRQPEVIHIDDCESDDKDRGSKEVFIYEARDHNVEIYSSNLGCLSPSKYLDDSIMRFFTAYLLKDVCDDKTAKSIHVFDNYFHRRLCETFTPKEKTKDFPDITKWIQLSKWFNGVNIFEKDFLIFPICQEDHWFAVIVCYPGEVADLDQFELNNARTPESNPDSSRPKPIPGMIVLDSLGINSKNYKENATREIRDFLDYEWRARLTTIKDFSHHSMEQYHPKLPQQKNAFDCGLYTLAYLKAFALDPVKFYQTIRKYTPVQGERLELPVELHDSFNEALTDCKRDALKELIMKKCRRKNGLNTVG